MNSTHATCEGESRGKTASSVSRASLPLYCNGLRHVAGRDQCHRQRHAGAPRSHDAGDATHSGASHLKRLRSLKNDAGDAGDAAFPLDIRGCDRVQPGSAIAGVLP